MEPERVNVVMERKGEKRKGEMREVEEFEYWEGVHFWGFPYIGLDHSFRKGKGPNSCNRGILAV